MDSPAWKEPWPWRDPKGGLKRDKGGKAGRQEDRKAGKGPGFGRQRKGYRFYSNCRRELYARTMG